MRYQRRDVNTWLALFERQEKADYQRWNFAGSIRYTFRLFTPDAVISGFSEPAISLYTLSAKSPRLNPVLKMTRRPFRLNARLRHCGYRPMSAHSGLPL